MTARRDVREGEPIELARDWVRVLARYRDPDGLRSVFELTVTVVPLVLIWVLAWRLLPISWALTLGLSVLNAGFFVRLFAIQHDCGHGAFFDSRQANAWVGRCLGVVTLTPFAVWRRSHSIHHSNAGNLERRGIGDIQTLTVREYAALPARSRLIYRVYRHPLVILGVFPTYVFWIQNRFPSTLSSGWTYWGSAMGTNAALAVALGLTVYFLGWTALFLIYLPTTLVAATIGMWLFYVQHQFEETSWDDGADWQLHDAALHGSSHYDLPPVLRWLTANIGIHHVHHLHSRIPSYRLPEVLADHPELAGATRITLRDSVACLRLKLWDESARKLVPFGQSTAAWAEVDRADRLAA